ncbi:MAG TPA: DUF6186 family protein [Acidimicrobiales bacterium]|nr:DUF6186 family protein [Acidimicrobiales bacterium]
MTGRQATLLVWAVLAAVVLVFQLAAVMSGGRRPGLGTMVRWLTAGRVGRCVAVLAWMWLGWHAFAR